MRWLLAIVLLTAISSAYAEGGTCPPGYYPQNGPGVMGCAPMPDDTSQQLPPPPTNKWKLTWGAIAMSSNGDTGVSVGKKSKSEAKREAIGKCKTWGASDCSLVLAYKHQCAVIANPIDSEKGVIGKSVVQGGPSIEVASQLALSSCSELRRGGGCKIVYSDCTKPILQN